MEAFAGKQKKYTKLVFDLSSVKRRFGLIFFTVIISFLFLNFFQPFGLYYDNSISKREVFIELFVAMSFVFVALTVSQFLARPVLKIYKTGVFVSFLWFVAEAVFVALIWAFLDSLDLSSAFSVAELWVENFIAYCLIVFIPYFLYLFFIHYKDTVAEKHENKNVESVVHLIKIKDESGEDKLIVKPQHLLYVKSADNYVEIFYVENDELSKILVRNTIKMMEPDLNEANVIRCHRSYMINTDKIETAKKTSSGYEVKLQGLKDILIPVSRTYVSELQKILPSG